MNERAGRGLSQIGPPYFTSEEFTAFHRDGYILVPGLLAGEEMQRVAAWTEEVEHWPEVPGKYMMYFERSLLDPARRLLNRLENFYPYHDGFRALFDDARVKQRVAELFGEPAVLFKDKINFKYPGGEGFKHHQDQAAGWWNYGNLFISALISIDEATRENGCLEIAPGNYQRQQRHLDREWRPFSDEEIRRMPFQPIPTRPGDVIFFDSFVPHGSYANLSNQRRRILYITYGRLSEGDHRVQYYADKRRNYPPDCERVAGREYVFRV